jgi:hypothetical protein
MAQEGGRNWYQSIHFDKLSCVCLSSRLQRGYNGVERAEFQRRE